MMRLKSTKEIHLTDGVEPILKISIGKEHALNEYDRFTLCDF